MAFDQPTRNRLQRLVSDCREVLTNEFTIQLQQHYGLSPKTGDITPLERLGHLDDRQRHTATLLRQMLDHYMAGQGEGKVVRTQAIERIVREQAFTVLNRLAALLMMEARGLLLPAVSQGPQSKAFELYRRVAGTALGETGDAYQTFLFSLCDEFALDLPALFDRFAPQGRLFPREAALTELLELLNHHEVAPLWAHDETIGWIYQYFNSQEERRAMRKASQAPRNSRELAVRNQFFTPRYVVEFLVDNSLGRQWFEATGGNTPLRERCQYLLVTPDEQPEPPSKLRDPRTVKLLDPACGSMHFGLYAFDLFLQIYRDAWQWEQQHGPGALDSSAAPEQELDPLSHTYPDEAAFLCDVPRLIIEHNIHGVEIDPRAAQIATLALWLRAQRAWHEDGVKASERPNVGAGNVIAAVAPPAEPDLREQVAANLEPREAKLFDATLKMLKELPELGVLLRAERELPRLIQEIYGGNTGDLFDREQRETWQQAEASLREALGELSTSANGTYQSRLFAQDALEGLRLIDLCSEDFDVIAMNPPFGQAPKGISSFYNDNYPDSSSEELAATFFTRAAELVTVNGFIAEISSRTIFYLYSLKEWRRNSLFDMAPLAVFVDMGGGELDDAVNETAAYVARKGRALDSLSRFGMFHRSQDKPGSIRAMVRHRTREKVYVRPMKDFLVLEDAPLCYWVSNSFLARLADLYQFGRDFADVQMGLAPRNEFRYSRLWWEVPPEKVGPNKKWTGYAKGGELSPYFCDVDLLLNAECNLREIKADLNRKYPYLKGNLDWVLHPENDYYEPGLTFGQRTTFLRVSALPKGGLFSVAGKAIFGREQSKESLLQSINTPSAQYLTYLRRERLQMDPQFQEGGVSRIPWPQIRETDQEYLAKLAMQNAALVERVTSFDETTHYFRGVTGKSEYDNAASEAKTKILQNEFDADRVMAEYLSLSEEDKKFIDEEIVSKWSSRSTANWYVYNEFKDEISYAVGCAYERWRMTASRAEKFGVSRDHDPFSAIPVRSPAMGFCGSGDKDGEYSVDILDISSDGKGTLRPSVERHLRELWGAEFERFEESACQRLKVKSLGEYFTKPSKFFADHYSKYSKSGRRAPIYWPLATASGSYTVWVYYPVLTGQTLFTAVNDFVEPKLQQVAEDIAGLRQAGTNRSRQDERRLEALVDFEAELAELRDTLLAIAPSYRPDQDDGVQITAAPLWRLFRHTPWRKVLKETWERLERGDYEWAKLAMAYWPDRVREKCVVDKSLAIAHDLEHLYEPPVTGKKSKKS